jgi:hypothetical protein
MYTVTIVIKFKCTNSQEEILTKYKYENIYGENDIFTFTPIDNIFISNKIIIYYIMSMFSIGKFNHMSIINIPKFEDGTLIGSSYIMYGYLKSNEIDKRIYITI